MTTVFISYAHESDAFRGDVKRLGAWLESKGCAVLSDSAHLYRPPEEGWQVWMKSCIARADTVLVICTPKYKARYDKTSPPDSGFGATYEGAIITQHIYLAAQRNTKFFPVLPDRGSAADIPIDLGPWWNNHRFPSGNAGILELIRTAPVPSSGSRGTVPEVTRRVDLAAENAAIEFSTEAAVYEAFEFADIPGVVSKALASHTREFRGPWFEELTRQLNRDFPSVAGADAVVECFQVAPLPRIKHLFRALRFANAAHAPQEDPSRKWAIQLTLLAAVRCIKLECWTDFARVSDQPTALDAVIGRAGTSHSIIACVGVAALLGLTIQLGSSHVVDLVDAGTEVDLDSYLLRQIYDQLFNAPAQRRKNTAAPLDQDQIGLIRQHFRDLRDDDGSFGAIVLRMSTQHTDNARDYCERLAKTLNVTVIEGLLEHADIAHPDSQFTIGELTAELRRLFAPMLKERKPEKSAKSSEPASAADP